MSRTYRKSYISVSSSKVKYINDTLERYAHARVRFWAGWSSKKYNADSLFCDDEIIAIANRDYDRFSHDGRHSETAYNSTLKEVSKNKTRAMQREMMHDIMKYGDYDIKKEPHAKHSKSAMWYWW